MGRRYSRSNFSVEAFGHDPVDMMELLKVKKTLMIEGPSATGKTFIAKRLAWAMIGEINFDYMVVLKMNPRSSYEDIIIGPNWNKEPVKKQTGRKPTGEPIYSMVKPNPFVYGPFYKLCKRAEKENQRDFFLILDDANSENVRSAFGDVLGLFEDTDRGEGCILKYSGEVFDIPSNVNIIATRDVKSYISDKDISFNRIFAHYETKPAFATTEFKQFLQEQDTAKMQGVVKLAEQFNKMIKSSAINDIYQIGHGYFCSTKLNNTGVKNVILYEIIPYIRGVLANNPTEVATWVEKFETAALNIG